MSEELTEPNEWHPNTIHNEEHGLDDYVLSLNLDHNDFKGTILDLGSGLKQRLNSEVTKSFSETPTIISVSPDMVEEANRHILNESPGFESKTAAATGQMLPFADGTFDRVLSVGAIINYAGFGQTGKASEEVVQAWMGEVVRVLKGDGVAKLSIVYGDQWLDAYLEAFKQFEDQADLTIQQCRFEDGEPMVVGTLVQENVYRLVIRKHTD